jgi:hypothetical protein
MAGEAHFVLRGDDQGAQEVFNNLSAAMAAAKVRSDATNKSLAAQASQLGVSVGAAKRYRASLTQVSSGLSGVAGLGHSVAVQLPDVASQMQSGTNAATIFAQQGLQVVQVHMRDLLKFIKAFPVGVGGVTAALAVGAGAWALYNSELVKAEENIKANQEALEDMVDIHRAVKEATILSAVASGELTNAEAERFLNAQRGADLFKASIDSQIKGRDELRQQLSKLTEDENRQARALEAAAEAGFATRAEVDAHADSVKSLEGRLASANTTLANTRTAQASYTESLNSVDESQRTATASRRALTEANEEAARGLAKFKAGLKEENSLLVARLNAEREFREEFRDNELAARIAHDEELRKQDEKAAKEKLEAAEKQAQQILDITISGVTAVANGEKTAREAALEAVRQVIAATLAAEAAKFTALGTANLIAGNLGGAAQNFGAAAFLGAGAGIAQSNLTIGNGRGRDTRSRSGQRKS